jgi:hypothetical protein
MAVQTFERKPPLAQTKAMLGPAGKRGEGFGQCKIVDPVHDACLSIRQV